MIRTTLFLALATAWCADALLMFALAEARWGSIMNRMFGALLFGLGLLALAIAFGPQIWRASQRIAVQWTPVVHARMLRLNALAHRHAAWLQHRRAARPGRVLTPTS